MSKQVDPDSRKELIFNLNNSDGAQAQRKEGQNENVDLEIILLGPKDNSFGQRDRTRKVNNSLESSKSINSVDSMDMKKQEDKGTTETNEKAPEDGQSKSSTAALRSRLLDRMEKRYREGRSPSADDDYYIDYMDYF